MVQYNERGMTIELRGGSQAAAHEQLMRGITTAARLALSSADRRESDEAGLLSLLDLLEELLPDEQQLKRMEAPRIGRK